MPSGPAAPETPDPTRKAHAWALPLALAVVLGLVLGWRSASQNHRRDSPVAVSADNLEDTIRLTIDAGDGQLAELEVPGESALDVLKAAGARSARYQPEVLNEGSSAFVKAIGPWRNEGGGGRNWTFEVNGVPGDRSAAISPVTRGDHVLWKYGRAE